MKLKNDREIQFDADRSVLEDVDHALAQKWHAGHADEGRYGFAALMANATPPANEPFEKALRERIVVELAINAEEAARTGSVRDQMQTIGDWILQVLRAPDDRRLTERIRDAVSELCGQFPVPGGEASGREGS